MSSTNRGAARNESDFYPTPEAAFKPLLPFIGKVLRYGAVAWEPACGDGRLVRWMQEAGISASGSDLCHRYDFLTDQTEREAIITNPPFSLALEFCQHAVTHAEHVFMLLRLGFLASEERRAFWEKHPASALFVLCKRPNFVMSCKCYGIPTFNPPKPSCGHKWTLPIESKRPADCPKCGAMVSVSTSDSADYAWVYWGSVHKGIFWL